MSVFEPDLRALLLNTAHHAAIISLRIISRVGQSACSYSCSCRAVRPSALRRSPPRRRPQALARAAPSVRAARASSLVGAEQPPLVLQLALAAAQRVEIV
uniref:Uncharacterized protein n=1 Tax=Prymnesium polylepis TaxID=72548 RepID=A0A7S4N3A9_9EUKA